MNDLISRSALIEEIERQKLGLSGNSELAYNLTLRIADIFCNIISKQPTVEAKPVVHCKDCKWLQDCKIAQYLGLDGYCSNADMRGGKND